MQDDAPHQLHVEMALTECALGGFPHGGKSFDQYVVEFGPVGELLLEMCSSRAELVVGHCHELRFDLVDGGDDRPQAFDVAVIGGTEQPPG